MKSQILKVGSVSLAYGFRTVVHDMSFGLESGQCLGILGPNGAGKTTLVRALLGMIKPKTGEVSILGDKAGSLQALARISYLPEDGNPPEFFTVREYLQFIGQIYAPLAVNNRMEEEIRYFELEPERKIQHLSKGNRRRLLLAAAFLTAPELMILDEPMSGLDPMMVIKLRQRLQSYIHTGGSVLFCSHVLAEVEKICSHVAVIRQGRMIYHASIQDAEKEFGSLEAAFTKQVESRI